MADDRSQLKMLLDDYFWFSAAVIGAIVLAIITYCVGCCSLFSQCVEKKKLSNQIKKAEAQMVQIIIDCEEGSMKKPTKKKKKKRIVEEESEIALDGHTEADF